MEQMEDDGSSFKIIFNDFIILGLPPPWEGNEDIHSQQRYSKILEHKINDDKWFDKLIGVLLGQDIMELLAGDFEILHQLKGVFKHIPQPSYERYSNIDEMV
jgi:hypothetical protein